MTPLVSIIIPTFDRPRFLKEAIEAALAQTHPNIEVLVFDNGTLDETLAVVEEIARLDSRLIFRRHERNIGMSANFNALAAAARGEFLVAIGDDDRLLPDFVARLVAEMTPEVNVVFCNHYLIDAGGRRLEEDSRAYNRPVPDAKCSQPVFWPCPKRPSGGNQSRCRLRSCAPPICNSCVFAKI